MNTKEINTLVLAYMGDAIYEKYIREMLIKQGISNVNDLQKIASKYVSARGQAKILEQIKDILTEDELDIIKRGRNHKSKSHPKNTDILTYKHATSFEALIGYLYLNNNTTKIEQIMEVICTYMEKM